MLYGFKSQGVSRNTVVVSFRTGKSVRFLFGGTERDDLILRERPLYLEVITENGL